MTALLLADDDIELCELLTEYLTSEGFSVDSVHDGDAAVEAILSDRYELAILDVMMPKMSGFDALREVRKSQQTPVLMLTARGDDIDRIVGLEMGADDYLPKPCNPRELVARIRAVLRRSKGLREGSAREEVLRVDDVELQAASRRVICKGVPVNLTGTEFNVLRELLFHAGEVLSKKELTETTLERKLTPYDRSMDMHVSNLRKKLGPNCEGEPRIKTIRGIGYIYVLSSSEKELR